MALPAIFRRDVGRDLAKGYWWYEDRQHGLGERFLAAVDSTFDRIEEYPELFAVRYGQVRMAIVPRFPYAIFYLVEPLRVVILAALHSSDDPAKWPKARERAR